MRTTNYDPDVLEGTGVRPNSWQASLSVQHETSGRGPGTVSTGRGDRGGVSYGSYQLASNLGRPQEFLAEEGAQWAAEFAGQRPGTAAFSQTWRDIAAREPEAFQQAQHDYIERTHYDVQASRVQARTTVAAVDGGVAVPGVVLSEHSRALQNVAWSTAVQHGPNSRIVSAAIADVRAAGIQDWAPGFDRAVIDAVMRTRAVDRQRTLCHFGGSRRGGNALAASSARTPCDAALEARPAARIAGRSLATSSSPAGAHQLLQRGRSSPRHALRAQASAGSAHWRPQPHRR